MVTVKISIHLLIYLHNNDSNMAMKINWRTVGYMKEASVRVMVEGKKRHLRFRVEEDEVLSNLHLEAKVLFNHLWFEIPVLQGKESVEAFLSKLDITTGDVIEIIKSPNNSGYFIITFENHVTETSKDQVLYHLHRLAKDIVYNHKW